MHTTRHFTLSVVFLVALVAAIAGSARAADDPNASAKSETELLAVLRSDAPTAEKAIACKNLAIYGSSEAVPDLAKLLPNPQLSSWARIALEAIPGEAVDEALRKASNSLEGRLLVGTINSIGVRRDATAVDGLAGRLKDADADYGANHQQDQARQLQRGFCNSIDHECPSLNARVRHGYRDHW